jgi:hypothetical protein
MVQYRLVAYQDDKEIHRSKLMPSEEIESYKSYLLLLGATVIEIWLVSGIIK